MGHKIWIYRRAAILIKKNSRDAAEKLFESFNDVFTDIINVLLFGGRKIVSEDELEDINTNIVTLKDGETRQIYRDVAKKWKKGNTVISVLGTENQTTIDKNMPFRMLIYDGAAYINMASHDESLCPVISLVLNFSDKKWDKKYTSVYERLGLDESCRDYVNDYKIKVIDVAFLPKEVRDKFRSDFAYAADWFCQIHEKGDYNISEFSSEIKIKHPDELSHFLVPELKDVSIYKNLTERQKKEGITMAEMVNKMFEIKKEEGIAEGENKERYRIVKNLMGTCSNEQIAETMALSLAEAEQLVKSCTV